MQPHPASRSFDIHDGCVLDPVAIYRFEFPHLTVAMLAFLLNQSTQEKITLEANTLIGRSADAQVRVVDNRISRQHAMIRAQGDDEFWFYDLGSVNGSLINERRVVTGQLLQPGDRIRLLTHEFEYQAAAVPVVATTDHTPDTTQPVLQSLPVIILVSDVRGYTTLSERMSTADLAQIIGGWYRECTRIIESHGGIVDKFIGDAVLAYWTDATPATRVQAARVPAAIAAACDTLAAQHVESLDGMAFGCGYAIHLGPVVLGHLGTGAYTLVGDTVNVAFRVQTLTRALNQDCLVSSNYINGWPEGASLCKQLGSHPVKGHSGLIDVYALDMTQTGRF
jgi:adenylate cyclase